ncbi:MAG: NAD-dependent epimerase/dehydratase family protein [Desulfobacterales bacterium]|nr:NAD-dependent epimerase/dehydratase family protein [Desulfobacterales bacterium]
MKNVLITGVSGYIGGKIARELSAHSKVQRLVGIDVRKPPFSAPKLIFARHDVRAPLTDFFKEHAIDSVIHAAYVLPPLHDKALMEEINVAGTQNVLESCRQAGVSRLMYTSSTTAYGFHPDNEIPLTEGSPLRGNDDFTYSKNKKELEFIFERFIVDYPEISVTVLRPCFVVGPGFNNPLATHLKKRFVLCPRPSAPMQFVHEDDLVRVMVMCLEKEIHGVYNVAGKGELSLEEMVRIMGGIYCPLPMGLMAPINQVAWALRLKWLTEFPSPALNLMRYSWIASPGKLIVDTGFAYGYDSRAAFQDFADSVKKVV